MIDRCELCFGQILNGKCACGKHTTVAAFVYRPEKGEPIAMDAITEPQYEMPRVYLNKEWLKGLEEAEKKCHEEWNKAPIDQKFDTDPCQENVDTCLCQDEDPELTRASAAIFYDDPVLDKDSISYFMTQMTQEEFTERQKGKEIVDYEFNRIKRSGEEPAKEKTYVKFANKVFLTVDPPTNHIKE